jgi:hypothetical protein
MRQDQREFLERDLAGLVEMYSAEVDRTGPLAPDALTFVGSAESVLDWLRGDAVPSQELLPFLRRRLEETDRETEYPEALKKVYEHDAFVAAIAELHDGPALDDRRRLLLLEQWKGRVADFGSDSDSHGHLGPGSTRMVEHGSRLVEWLEGGARPGEETRRFLEEQLDGFKKDSGYDEMVGEHDRIVAAIEAVS